MDFMFIGYAYQVFVSGPGNIDICDQNFGPIMIGKYQIVPVRIADLAFANKGKAALVTDAIDGHEINVVFHGTCVGDVIGSAACARRPIGGQDDQVGIPQCQ